MRCTSTITLPVVQTVALCRGTRCPRCTRCSAYRVRWCECLTPTWRLLQYEASCSSRLLLDRGVVVEQAKQQMKL
uniref:Putative secreted protein n=1 Tax=Anopheles marajoara TaxID=58244 RepID=A0A2M4CD06_9DIPT